MNHQDNEHDSSSRISCEHCQQQFSSRNALFRHLRAQNSCGAKSNMQENRWLVRKSFALLLAYRESHDTDEDSDDSINKCSLAHLAGKEMEDRFVEVLRTATNSSEREQLLVLSRTQSSVARLRSNHLQQDAECMACGDVLVLTIQLPMWITKDMTYLEQIVTPLLSPEYSIEKDGVSVDLLACKLLEENMPLHAERSCTQYVYHYLLPISWLPNSAQLLEWLEQNDLSTPPPGDTLRRLKHNCRSAESTRINPGDRDTYLASPSESNGARIAAGRFGALGHKERRPWHNFCSFPLSPNHESGWRVIDRCRIVDFPKRSHILLEIRGDELLQGQVRRLVGTLVAMTHGWIPESTLGDMTSTQQLVKTPMAPPGRLYLSETRFHFEEMRTGEESLFESPAGGTVWSHFTREEKMQQLQDFIITERQKAVTSELDWLFRLQNIDTVQICRQLIVSDTESTPSESPRDPCLAPVPTAFKKVLAMLSDIVQRQEWPSTSSARSQVISNINSQEEKTQGSFTIVNPQFCVSKSDLLRGNQLFPELVKAVFALEADLASTPRMRLTSKGIQESTTIQRPVSSHCAVNCDAQFTPHVDSGRGAGQSLSMIVGLGDYEAGYLNVEENSFDIRYKPLEFDGWKLRHWTSPFSGQRFSLVWFTPEMK